MKQTTGRVQDGFTLLELMVAFSLFSVAALSMANVFASNVRFNTRNERTTEAVEVAQQYLDELRVLDPATFPGAGASTTKTFSINGKSYLATATYCSPSTYCTSGNIKAIHVRVTHNSTVYYEVDTVFTELR